jgi:hypothetical protein
MGRFHHSKKAHSEGKEKKRSKFTISKTGNKKLDEDFVYTQKHKNIWNSFCNFLDERFAEDDLSEILDAEEISRLKILKSYVSKEAAHLKGLKKLKQKFNRTTVLVLKHVDAQINLNLHQLLKSDPIK